MSSSKIVLSVNEWNPTSTKYMAPKINERGGKSINIISKQTNRGLHISTPLLMTWGVSDFVDEKGESDGKFSISLNFPNEEYKTQATDLFLQKLKDFENQILDDAVKNSENWWGEEMSREVAKHTFFPFIKYSKNKETKKTDYSRPPSIRAKVPYYNSKWGVEIYDTKSNMIFPCDNEHLTPVDFIPKMSSVACVLQCGGIWIGGKGWGLTWKLIQCVVKPREIQSVYGKLQIQLSPEDKNALEAQEFKDDIDDDNVSVSKPQPPSKPLVINTFVEDSDDDEPLSNRQPEPVVPATPVPVPEEVKVIETTPVAPQLPVEEAPKKKVIRKKAV
jgi:hypothetical protein